MNEAEFLTNQLEAAGATREKVIEIIDGFGDSIDWTNDNLQAIIGTVWESDMNSGDDPENWIINEICRTFNVGEIE